MINKFKKTLKRAQAEKSKQNTKWRAILTNINTYEC